VTCNPPTRDIIFGGSGGIQKTQITMDDIESIEAQISYLQEDIGQRLQLLNDSQSTVQFKSQPQTLLTARRNAVILGS